MQVSRNLNRSKMTMKITIQEFKVKPRSNLSKDEQLKEIRKELYMIWKSKKINNRLANLIKITAKTNQKELESLIKHIVLDSIPEFQIERFIDDYEEFLRQIKKIRNLYFMDLKRLYFKRLDPQFAVDQILELPRDQRLYRYIKIIFDQGLYFSYFERKFIQKSVEYYGEQSKVVLQSSDDYLKFVVGVLEIESKRCIDFKQSQDGFIPIDSKSELIKELQRVLIHDNCNAILDHYFPSAMNNNDAQRLSLIYTLLKQTGDLDALKARFCQHILENGTTIVHDESQDAKMIERLISFMQILKTCIEIFDNNTSFNEALKEQFALFMNKRQNKPAELIALYIDKLLKDSKKSEESVEELLDQCLVLFRLVQGKDIFEAFYGKAMAKRLLLSKSASIDAEKSMILKLKIECGGGFTSKLEGMFKDVEMSKDIMAGFLESKYSQSEIDFNVSVLTFGYWPTYPMLDLALPSLVR